MKTIEDLFAANTPYAFHIVEGSVAEDGGYIPVISFLNEPGYYPMSGQGPHAAPWNWGKDHELAQKLCDEYNEKRGVDKDTALRIVCSSMKG